MRHNPVVAVSTCNKRPVHDERKAGLGNGMTAARQIQATSGERPARH